MKSLKEILGINLPIIQAPMAGVQDYRLALAVSEAGGLGSLPCAMLSAEGLQQQLTSLTDATKNPFNVNFFCHTSPQPSEKKAQDWLALLKPYYTELNLDQSAVAAGASRVPFDQKTADILSDFKPPVVSFHFGLPSPDLLRQVKSWGAVVLSSATTVEEARWLERQGADAIIAQGLESGGHRGMFLSEDISTQVGTFALLPQVVEAVNVPVIAAGGIADAKGVAAALGLGASAVQVGTAYLLSHEATTSDIHRAALQKTTGQTTALTNLFSGRPARGILNRVIRELGPMSDVAPEFPLASSAIAPLRAEAEKRGLNDFTPLWSGQNTSGCQQVSAAEITQSLVQGMKIRNYFSGR